MMTWELLCSSLILNTNEAILNSSSFHSWTRVIGGKADSSLRLLATVQNDKVPRERLEGLVANPSWTYTPIGLAFPLSNCRNTYCKIPPLA